MLVNRRFARRLQNDAGHESTENYFKHNSGLALRVRAGSEGGFGSETRRDIITDVTRMRMLKPIARISIACLALAACRQTPPDSPSPEIAFLNTPDMVDSGLPFSSAVRAGDMIYLSGVIGTREDDPNRLVEGGIVPEARRTMEIIKSSLEAFGSSMDRVVKCTVFLADEADRASFNEVYKTYFDKMPARSGVTVSGIDLGARVEIECVAVAS